MIIGRGDIASVLRSRKGAVFFAAGVSNSNEQDEQQFYRERKELAAQIALANAFGDCLFYFGSISCFFKTTRYTKHKEEMEQFIRDNCKNYNIIRIGNILWGTNPNTFINFIHNKKAKGDPVEIRDEWKYMISKEQLLLLTDNLPLTGKNEISVFGECKKVADII